MQTDLIVLYVLEGEFGGEQDGTVQDTQQDRNVRAALVIVVDLFRNLVDSLFYGIVLDERTEGFVVESDVAHCAVLF